MRLRYRAKTDPKYSELYSFRTADCVISLIKGPHEYYVCIDQMYIAAGTETEARSLYDEWVEAERARPEDKTEL